MKKTQSQTNHPQENLLPLLIKLNKKRGHLSEKTLKGVAKQLNLNISQVYGVATFYSLLSVDKCKNSKKRIFKIERKPIIRKKGAILNQKDSYLKLEKILKTFSKKQIIEKIKKSKLTGRGGAEFPTGIKWESVAKEKNKTKYIICNADEGEPHTFKDRIIIETISESIIAGMIIASYTVNAKYGYIYLRGEYEYLSPILKKAIAKAKRKKLLNNFEIKIFLGAGSYICGEETALIESMEGKRGEPRIKPPFPCQNGLWQKPTLINNVETFANIILILNNDYKNTRLFSLNGKVKSPGLYELPDKTTIENLIYKYAGGIKNNAKINFVQTGAGASGEIFPPHLLKKEIGGVKTVIVYDEKTKIIDILEKEINFFKQELCGKCVPCREGIIALDKIISRIKNGQKQEKDLELIKEICEAMKSSSFCALGESIAILIKSVLKYFRKELFLNTPSNLPTGQAGSP